MPDETISNLIQRELWLLIPTVVYFLVGLALMGFSIWLVELMTPFSIRKEIEEDHNTAVAILLGAGLISLGLLLSAVIRG